VGGDDGLRDGRAETGAAIVAGAVRSVPSKGPTTAHRRCRGTRSIGRARIGMSARHQRWAPVTRCYELRLAIARRTRHERLPDQAAASRWSCRTGAALGAVAPTRRYVAASAGRARTLRDHEPCCVACPPVPHDHGAVMYPPVPRLSATMQNRAGRADKSMITDHARTRRRALIGSCGNRQPGSRYPGGRPRHIGASAGFTKRIQQAA
jgi:hypothetical protein